jgi:TolB-like protein/Flp pilus assembly protein TadD
MADLQAQLQSGLGGSYALERELGRGGMATVFLARDLKHDRPVALKVLHPELAATLGPDRFQREIRLAAGLQHPHILTVLDSGTAGPGTREAGGGGGTERLWFTMPYVEGESLRDRLRRERQLPVEDALRIAGEAAQALQYAHEHGVIHRDIKPENLLLTRDGNTLVADFGIARALGGGPAGGPEEARLTETGLALGTPAYMSPEQSAGDRGLDARTDIYSLAAVLYEMLAGEPPYTGATTQAMLVKRLTEPAPSVRAVRPNVPEAVDQAIRKALAPVPADRFATVAALARALIPPAAPAPVLAATVPVPATPSAAAASRTVTHPHRYRPVVVLGLGFLLGLGVLFGWLRRHGDGPGNTGDVKRLAVLPFDNLGAPEDEYFADGVTDEIRGKLAALPTLQVTASRSVAEYKKSTKDLATIARELGVDYLLVGKVRWEKGEGEGSRVRVSPELIEVSTGSTEWQQPFDARLTDVFQVQADIAGRVAQALDVAMGAGEREALAERPTANLAAYDAYLRGWEASRGMSQADPNAMRRALLYYDQAVALDSGFAVAWAQRSRAYTNLYTNSVPEPAAAEAALASARRARALAPDRPEGYLALADYYRGVTGDAALALEQATLGSRIAPTDVSLLISAALTQQVLGRWEEATALLSRAQALDPRSVATATRTTRGLLYLRRYDEALAAAARGLEVAPGDLALNETVTMIYLGRGDLPGARAALARAARHTESAALVAYFSTYYDLFWPLDDAQRTLLFRLGPEYFDDDAGSWGLALAGAHAAAGHPELARAYADSARAAFEAQVRDAPDNAQLHVLLGTALAYVGRKAEAIREGRRGLELLPPSTNAFAGPYVQHQLARIYILTGEPDQALDLLEPLLSMPYFLSPGWLRLDPTFEPLRNHPRFKALVEGTS